MRIRDHERIVQPTASDFKTGGTDWTGEIYFVHDLLTDSHSVPDRELFAESVTLIGSSRLFASLGKDVDIAFCKRISAETRASRIVGLVHDVENAMERQLVSSGRFGNRWITGPGMFMIDNVCRGYGLHSRLSMKPWVMLQPKRQLAAASHVVVGATFTAEGSDRTVDMVSLPPAVHYLNELAYQEAAHRLGTEPGLAEYAEAGKASYDKYRRLGVPTLGDLFFHLEDPWFVYTRESGIRKLNDIRRLLSESGDTHWALQL